MKDNVQILNSIATKMGISLIDCEKTDKCSNIEFSRILNISKPNRPEVKRLIQKQLEAIK